MNRKNSELYFLLLLLAGVLVITFFIFKPFLYVLILALVFSTVFAPIHKKLLDQTAQNKGLSALLSTLLVIIIFVVPLYFIATQIFRESANLYSSLSVNGGVTNLSNTIGQAIHGLNKYSPIPADFSFNLDLYIKQGLQWLMQNIGSIFSNAVRIIAGIILFIFSLYFLFKDGQKIKDGIIIFSPLKEEYDERIFSKLTLAINSVIRGSLIVAIIQGILTAVGFTIFSVPNPALWGSVTVIAALIPGIGTTMVIVPAILFLFFTGHILPAVGLLAWGVLAVGLIDNFLGPKLVEKGVHLHPFLILLSVLGGISFFGPMGFLLGPLVLSLLSALLDVYFTLQKEQEG
jgi:predicted PurR-regulated permease PerM